LAVKLDQREPRHNDVKPVLVPARILARPIDGCLAVAIGLAGDDQRCLRRGGGLVVNVNVDGFGPSLLAGPTPHMSRVAIIARAVDVADDASGHL
jgi:hypothetical protein